MELLTWCRVQWDRALALVAMLAGSLLVAIGWLGVSSTPYVAKQVPYVVSGGIGGLGLLIVAATLWLSADLNDEWRALDALDANALLVEQGGASITALEERVRGLELINRLAEAESSPEARPAGRRGSGQRAGAT